MAQRSEKGIKVRQPLAKLKVKSSKFKVLQEELLALIRDEVNVKEIIFDDKIKNEVELDTVVTDELRKEGILRDIIRSVQDFRKEQGLKPEDQILAWFDSSSKINSILQQNKEFLSKEVRAKEILIGESSKNDLPQKEISIGKEKISLTIQKII